MIADGGAVSLRRALRHAGAVLGVLLGAACSSQSDDFGRPLIDGAEIEDGGVFETTIRGDDGNNANWIFFFGPEEPDGADNRIVAYRDNDIREEFLTGRFIVNDQNQDRRANVLLFDVIDVPVEPPDITPGAEPETRRERRVRPAVLSITLLEDGRMFGTLSGDESVGATIDGRYLPTWYEEISGFQIVAGQWRELDSFGRERISIEINPEGGFGGRQIDDCTLSGEIAPINPRFNLYRLFVSAQCSETLEATGLATIRPRRNNPQVGGSSTLIGVVPYRDGSEVVNYFLDATVEPDFGRPTEP